MTDQSKGTQNIQNASTGSLGAPNIPETPNQTTPVEKSWGTQPQPEVPNPSPNSDNHGTNDNPKK